MGWDNAFKNKMQEERKKNTSKSTYIVLEHIKMEFCKIKKIFFGKSKNAWINGTTKKIVGVLFFACAFDKNNLENISFT